MTRNRARDGQLLPRRGPIRYGRDRKPAHVPRLRPGYVGRAFLYGLALRLVLDGLHQDSREAQRCVLHVVWLSFEQRDELVQRRRQVWRRWPSIAINEVANREAERAGDLVDGFERRRPRPVLDSIDGVEAQIGALAQAFLRHAACRAFALHALAHTLVDGGSLGCHPSCFMASQPGGD